jgi:DEAD/DEAH box helicase domain-containing protein
VLSWKVEQQITLGPGEGVAVFSRPDFLLTPTAGGKPIAVYTDGWEYHRGRLATDAEQRMALQRSGRYLFWSLNWDDVVEATPTAQNPLEPNGLTLGLVPAFASNPEAFTERWWPQALLQPPHRPPPLRPREAQLASSFQLLMAYLANPSEALWQGLAQQFCLAQASPLAIDSPELSAAIGALHLAAHGQEWVSSEPSRRIGQHLTPAPGLQILNLVDLDRHGAERRHPAASFRAINFEPDSSRTDPQQQAAWREWLRQGNLFQFLPHLLLSTPGWGGREQPAAVDPPQVWVVADPAKASPDGPGASDTAAVEWQRAWRDLGRLAPDHAIPLLEALAVVLQASDHPMPEAGFELEGARGEVLAEAELAWPEQRLAVVGDPVDAEPFTAAGWRCWSLEDPPGAIAAALREALTRS